MKALFLLLIFAAILIFYHYAVKFFSGSVAADMDAAEESPPPFPDLSAQDILAPINQAGGVRKLIDDELKTIDDVSGAAVHNIADKKEKWSTPPDLTATDTIKPEMGEKPAPIRTPFVDVCQCGERKRPTRKRAWRIVHYRHNHSDFHGGYQASDYSGLTCLVCGNNWRTRAKYVESLQHITNFEIEMIAKAKRFPPGYIEFVSAKLMLRGEFGEREAISFMNDIVIVAGESWPDSYTFNNALNGGVLESTIITGITPADFNAIFAEDNGGPAEGSPPTPQTLDDPCVCNLNKPLMEGPHGTAPADGVKDRRRGDLYKRIKKYLSPLEIGDKITASEIVAAFYGVTRDEADGVLRRLLMNMYLSASSSPRRETVYTITKRTVSESGAVKSPQGAYPAGGNGEDLTEEDPSPAA